MNALADTQQIMQTEYPEGKVTFTSVQITYPVEGDSRSVDIRQQLYVTKQTGKQSD